MIDSDDPGRAEDEEPDEPEEPEDGAANDAERRYGRDESPA
ncbi:MAG: hypothetical protein ACR2HP_15380 [Ilumatobacteraceae bacterium]